jgi:hypothetical protein
MLLGFIFFIDGIVASFEIPFTDINNINEKPIDRNSGQSFNPQEMF